MTTTTCSIPPMLSVPIAVNGRPGAHPPNLIGALFATHKAVPESSMLAPTPTMGILHAAAPVVCADADRLFDPTASQARAPDAPRRLDGETESHLPAVTNLSGGLNEDDCIAEQLRYLENLVNETEPDTQNGLSVRCNSSPEELSFLFNRVSNFKVSPPTGARSFSPESDPAELLSDSLLFDRSDGTESDSSDGHESTASFRSAVSSELPMLSRAVQRLSLDSSVEGKQLSPNAKEFSMPILPKGLSSPPAITGSFNPGHDQRRAQGAFTCNSNLAPPAMLSGPLLQPRPTQMLRPPSMPLTVAEGGPIAFYRSTPMVAIAPPVLARPYVPATPFLAPAAMPPPPPLAQLPSAFMATSPPHGLAMPVPMAPRLPPALSPRSSPVSVMAPFAENSRAVPAKKRLFSPAPSGKAPAGTEGGQLAENAPELSNEVRTAIASLTLHPTATHRLPRLTCAGILAGACQDHLAPEEELHDVCIRAALWSVQQAGLHVCAPCRGPSQRAFVRRHRQHLLFRQL